MIYKFLEGGADSSISLPLLSLGLVGHVRLTKRATTVTSQHEHFPSSREFPNQGSHADTVRDYRRMIHG